VDDVHLAIHETDLYRQHTLLSTFTLTALTAAATATTSTAKWA
jgi:hypothetical protein